MTGKELEILIYAANFSLTEASEAIGVSRQTIHSWIKRDFVPPHVVDRVKAAIAKSGASPSNNSILHEPESGDYQKNIKQISHDNLFSYYHLNTKLFLLY